MNARKETMFVVANWNIAEEMVGATENVWHGAAHAAEDFEKVKAEAHAAGFDVRFIITPENAANTMHVSKNGWEQWGEIEGGRYEYEYYDLQK